MLSMDMASYCEACSNLKQNEAQIRKEYKQQHPKDPQWSDDDYLNNQNQYVREKTDLGMKEAFQRERDEASDSLCGAAGATHWLDIKRDLNALCNTANSSEQFLSMALIKEDTGTLVIQSLNNSFIELLKNSMDAMINRYLNGLSVNTTLEVCVSIPGPIIVDSLSVVISDNAGGFPTDYLDKFDEFKVTKKYAEYREKDKHASEKGNYNPDSKYYFGGSGSGMNLLCKEMAGEMDITNSGEGAKITLTSSLMFVPVAAISPVSFSPISPSSASTSMVSARSSPAFVNTPPADAASMKFFLSPVVGKKKKVVHDNSTKLGESNYLKSSDSRF